MRSRIAFLGATLLIFVGLALAVAPVASPATVAKTVMAAEGDACESDALCFDTEAITAAEGDTLDVAFENPSANEQQHNWCVKIGQTTHCAPGPDESTYSDPGQGGSVSIADLPDGTYAFYCAFPGHRSAGMEGTLTVSAASTNGGNGGNNNTGGNGNTGNRTPGFEAGFLVAALGAAVLVARRLR